MAFAGISDMSNAFHERDEMSLVEFMLNVAIGDPTIELVLLQAIHSQSMLDQFGGFYLETKY